MILLTIKMVNVIIIYLLVISTRSLIQTVSFGRWEKDSFEKNDLYIDRSRFLSERTIVSIFYQNSNEKDFLLIL